MVHTLVKDGPCSSLFLKLADPHDFSKLRLFLATADELV